MKRSVLAASVSLALCMAFLTGCSLVGGLKLEQPYTYEERTVWTDTGFLAVNEKADPFAKDLCVITEENQSADASVTSEAAAVFGIDDHSVTFSKNAFEKLYPASITKVMTAIIAIKYGTLTDLVEVTDAAVITESGATLCGIKPGDKLTMNQLLYGLMLPSGNDAGAAIAVHMSGSEKEFADLMNEEAKKLGATGTHFVNPHGLNNEEHYTTAYDLYLIFNEALKLPQFREVSGSTLYQAEYVDGAGKAVSKTWKGGNRYMTKELETPEGLTVFSGKTGTTGAAGYCLIMASRDTSDKEYISVVLKAPSRSGLYDNMTNIISKIVD